MTRQEGFTPEQVRKWVGEYYDPRASVDMIDIRDRDVCITLLSSELGFHCVASYVEVGGEEHDSTVDILAQEAMRDSITIASRGKDAFFPGPHPWIESGVGIWTTA